MSVEPPDHLRQSAKEVPVYMLDRWIREAQWTIEDLRELASRVGPKSPLIQTIEALENDLVLYREEKLRRVTQKAY